MCSVVGHYKFLVVLHKKLTIICFHVDHHSVSLVVEVFFNCPFEKKHLCNLQVAQEHTFLGILHTKHIIQFVNFIVLWVYNDGLVKFVIQIVLKQFPSSMLPMDVLNMLFFHSQMAKAWRCYHSHQWS